MESVVEKKSQEFSKAWKYSDIILVVGDVEFHVHRNILCMQSPVFETMLTGEFKEAKEKKVELEDKPGEFLEFLKLLYPRKMFRFTLHSKNVIAVIAIADKYQAESVVKQCFDATAITEANALKMLPYASRYDQTVYETCIRVAKKRVSCKVLKENASDVARDDLHKILFGKCSLLESALAKGKKELRVFRDSLQPKFRFDDDTDDEEDFTKVAVVEFIDSVEAALNIKWGEYKSWLSIHIYYIYFLLKYNIILLFAQRNCFPCRKGDPTACYTHPRYYQS